MSNVIGKEQVITIEGKQYKLARLTRGIMKDFANWAKSLLPNPLDVVAQKLHLFKDFPELQQMMVKEAVKDAKTFGEITSPEVQEIMDSFDGQVKMVTMLLQVHQPEITEDVAFDLAMKFVQEKEEPFRSDNPS